MKKLLLFTVLITAVAQSVQASGFATTISLDIARSGFGQMIVHEFKNQALGEIIKAGNVVQAKAIQVGLNILAKCGKASAAYFAIAAAEQLEAQPISQTILSESSSVTKHLMTAAAIGLGSFYAYKKLTATSSTKERHYKRPTQASCTDKTQITLDREKEVLSLAEEMKKIHTQTKKDQ